MFKNFAALLQGLMEYVGKRGITDFNPGSLLRTVLEAAAAMMEECYYLLSILLPKFWIRTSVGEWLDRRAEDFGKARKPGARAAGVVRIGRDTPAPFQILIPAGTVFELGDTAFATQEDAALRIGQSEVEAAVEAQQIGAASNYPEGAVLHQVGIAISGVEWAKVKKLEGGADIESDEDFRGRLLDWLRNPGTSGNIADYKNWALEIEDVTGVSVAPTWDGPGTVKVIILGPNKSTPDEALIRQVQDIIAPADEYSETRKAPIGAAVTVVGAQPVEVNVEATLFLDPEKPAALETVKENFTYALRDYLASMALKSSLVRYNRIASLLTGQAGVLDYEGYTLNGAGVNVAITDEQIAVVGTVIFHAGNIGAD